MGLWYPMDSGFKLTTFSDANHAECLDTRKSTSGGIQFLGEKLVSWMLKKQDCSAMLTAQAEDVVLSETNKKREKDKETRARVRNQPEITAGSARLSQRKK
ncbi:hypothetical protein Tco_0478659 [Tanacetum coccineum]